MQFGINEDQQMLQDSVRRWLAKEYSHSIWRGIATSKPGWSESVWKRFADMGWLAASLPLEHGGLGGGAVENAILAEEFGAALVLEPYFSTVVLGGGLIELAGTKDQRDRYLPRIAAGELRIAFAFAEDALDDMTDVRTFATILQNGSSQITGRKITVWDAPAAEKILVLARGPGDAVNAGAICLYLVDGQARGISMETFPMLDGRRGAHIEFDGAPVAEQIGTANSTWLHVQQVVDRALAYLSAEACGAMRATLDQSVLYLQQRRQFGQSLATFQVLRHRVVDMTIQTELLRSLALHAANTANATPQVRSSNAAAAKVFAGKWGRKVGQEAIQLHGGMGMTDQLATGHYLKRLLMIETMFGNSRYHQRRFGEMNGL